MHRMLARISDPERREQGFTLIELLVVIIIIGILSAIAIPIFLNQKKKATSATMKSDVRNAVSTVESQLTESQAASITGVTASPGADFTINSGAALVVVSGVNNMQIFGSGTAGYCIAADNPSGSAQGYYYDSTTGAQGSTSAVTSGTTVIATSGACNGLKYP